MPDSQEEDLAGGSGTHGHRQQNAVIRHYAVLLQCTQEEPQLAMQSLSSSKRRTETKVLLQTLTQRSLVYNGRRSRAMAV